MQATGSRGQFTLIRNVKNTLSNRFLKECFSLSISLLCRVCVSLCKCCVIEPSVSVMINMSRESKEGPRKPLTLAFHHKSSSVNLSFEEK